MDKVLGGALKEVVASKKIKGLRFFGDDLPISHQQFFNDTTCLWAFLRFRKPNPLLNSSPTSWMPQVLPSIKLNLNYFSLIVLLQFKFIFLGFLVSNEDPFHPNTWVHPL
jgi:hypothetical protein